MPWLGRALVLVASLTAGSWVGFGHVPVNEARALAERLVHPKPLEVPAAPLPADRATQTVDPAQLPDPSPFPRTNPDNTTHRAWLLAEGPAHEEGDGRRLVTFTFDDGPFPETTPDVLALLAKHRVRATFFMVGQYLDGDSDRAVTSRAVARQVAAAGHFIGNHTHDHKQLTAIPRAQALAQIDEGARSIERATGTRPVLFRPPYGALDPWLGKQLRARGDDVILWSVEAEDMTHGDPAEMTDLLRTQIEFAGGGIVLLHDIRPTTIPVLASLLDWLDAHPVDPEHPERIGYEVVDLAQYLQATARAPQPFANRKALERARAIEWQREHPRAGVPRLVQASTTEDPEPVPL